MISLCWLLFIPHEEMLLQLHVLPKLSSAENKPQIGPGLMVIVDFNTPVFSKQPEGPDCNIFTKWHWAICKEGKKKNLLSSKLAYFFFVSTLFLKLRSYVRNAGKTQQKLTADDLFPLSPNN